MTTPRTYGIFALKFIASTMKEVGEIGFVHDLKWAFLPGARAERQFAPEYAGLVFGADDAGGLKLEISPRVEGEHLPGVLIPTTLRGELKLSDNGMVQLSTRVSEEALEAVGFDAGIWLRGSFSLECTVSDQPTLEEQTEQQIQDELAAHRHLQQDAAEVIEMGRTLAGDGTGQALPEIDADPLLTEPQDAPPLVDVPPPPTLRLDPIQPGEDLPFPIDDGTDGQQPSA